MAWVGSVVNAVTGRRDNYFNKEEADKARDWSKEMSNTEVQRRVIDMKKAGINPMLAATSGGSSTPSSASANAAGGGSDLGLTGAYFSAEQLKLAKAKNAADVRQVEANTAKTMAETELIEASVPYSARDAQSKSDKLAGDLKQQMYDIGLRRAEAYLKARDYDELQPLAIEYQRMLNRASELGMSEREATSDFFKQVGEGSKWMSLLRDLLIGIRATR